MNRRSFLQVSSIAAIGTVATNRINAQVGFNPLLVGNSQTAHIGAIANGSRGYVFASDWHNITGTTTAMNLNLRSTNIDALAKAAAYKITPAQVTPALLATANARVLQAVRVYNPSCTAAQIQTYFNTMNNQMTPTTANNTLSAVRSIGITPYINLWIAHTIKIQQALTSTGGAARLDSGGKLIMPMRPPNDPGAGGGGYTCEDNSAAFDLVSTVVGVLAIFAAPELIGAAAVFAGAGVLMGWAGAGVAAWGLGSLYFC